MTEEARNEVKIDSNHKYVDSFVEKHLITNSDENKKSAEQTKPIIIGDSIEQINRWIENDEIMQSPEKSLSVSARVHLSTPKRKSS